MRSKDDDDDDEDADAGKWLFSKSNDEEDGTMSDFSHPSNAVLVVIILFDDWLGLMVKALMWLLALVAATNTPHNTADPNLILNIYIYIYISLLLR